MAEVFHGGPVVVAPIAGPETELIADPAGAGAG
jgi:hypothetical protein